jgi:ribonuclease HI
MKEEDKASTSFITPFGTYCFVRMPEGLKNAGSTFSRLTKTVLESQVGRNIFTYVDDIVVASKNKEGHLADLAKTFANMRDARLCLNPEKCVFDVRQGKILGTAQRTSKCNMTELEKIAYAVVMASHKLHHYFEAFKVWVTSDRGLSELFRNPEASVRIAKWAAMLSGYHITFEPRTAIKSQVLADFIVDWTGPITQLNAPAEKVWTIHCDGAWCHAGAGAAAVITSPTGVKHRYAARLSFALESDRCTNNVAENEAVILGLRKLQALGVTTCIIKTDSKVVAGQVEKDYAAKDPALMQYLTAVRSLERQCKGFTLQHVDRAKNEETDTLAKAAARGEVLPSDVFYHVIGTPAVRSPEGLQITNDTESHRIVNLIMTEDWWTPITLFL